MESIVVFVEHTRGAVRRASLEALAVAHTAGAKVTAMVTGPGGEAAAAELGRWGADRVVQITGAEAYSPDGTARDLHALVREQGARACLMAATSTGRDLLPRVAALLDVAPLTDCTALSLSGEHPTAVRPVLAGKAIVTHASDAPVLCASLRPNALQPVEAGKVAEVVQQAAVAERIVTVVEVAAKVAGKLDVKEAPIVVSGGRGLKGPENFALLEELAAAFGNAAVGASRAVVDAGWRPHAEQVGQTGKTVAPQLYIAVGISGAIQHLAGMRTAKTIVAINKDPAAPIFKVADYGIVGDALEVLPALTAAVRAARAG